MDEVNLKVNLSYGSGIFLQDNDTRDPELKEGFFTQFIFWGIVLPVIGLFGFFGNTLTMIVLWRREMQSTTILYLRALVVTDTLIIIGAVIVLTPYSICDYLQMLYYRDVVYPVIFAPFNFLIMAAQACNVWLTVSVSVERYIAICHPFRAARICTRKKALIVIVVVGFISLVFNVPRLFATEPRECKENNTLSECYVLEDTDFGNTDAYKIVYSNLMYSILIYVVPLAVLFVLNIMIIKELMRMRQRRIGTNIQDENEANLSLILVLIVIVFIVCQTPGLISQFEIFTFPAFLKWIAVSNTLFVLNSSVNFLIYTAVGKRFRKILFKIFRTIVHRKNKNSATMTTRVRTVNGYELAGTGEPHTMVVATGNHVNKEEL